jgi:hypothetical protein
MEQKLKHSVQMHDGKDSVPDRTRDQCRSRWHNVLNPSITLMAGRKGKWAENEDYKLKVVVQKM